jgi:hypothetical protein
LAHSTRLGSGVSTNLPRSEAPRNTCASSHTTPFRRLYFSHNDHEHVLRLRAMLQRGSDTFTKEHLADITSSLIGGRWPHVLRRHATNANRRVSVVVGVRTKVFAVSSSGDWHTTVLSSYFTTHSTTLRFVRILHYSFISLYSIPANTSRRSSIIFCTRCGVLKLSIKGAADTLINLLICSYIIQLHSPSV